MRHIYSQIIIILFLFIGSPVLLARAEDTVQGDAQWESASSWEELKVWLKDHESAGGNIKLTQDINMTGDFFYSRFFSGMTEPGEVCIDTGAYHLLVEGNIQFAGGPRLAITGDGEVFRVAKAGQLKMTAITVENRTGDCAIYQEEGGTLCVGGGTEVDGGIHYAELPVATAYPYVEVMVPKEGELTEYLPTTVNTYYNYQGCDNSSQMSVEWDLEAFESQIADRQRFQMSGQIVGATQLVPPAAEVVFFDQDITFSEAQFYEYQTRTLVSLDYYCRGGLEPQLYYSLDQEAYTPVSSHPFLYEEEKGQAQFTLIKGRSLSECAEDEIPWEPGDPPISFVFGWQTEAGEQYSDVICYDGTGGVTAGEPYDGNRGGGTDLGGDSPENGGLEGGDTDPTLPSSPLPGVSEEEKPGQEEEPIQEPKAAPFVLAGNAGSRTKEIVSKTDSEEGTPNGAEKVEDNSLKEASRTTDVSKTTAASKNKSVSGSKAVSQGDSGQDSSKAWPVILITGSVLLTAFGLSGVILKKLYKR